MSDDDDDTERHRQIVPYNQRRAVSRYDENRALERDARMLDPGWGLANTVANLRHRSAARLMKARSKHVESWRRFDEELVRLGEAMIERERMRRRLQNLDATLDAEEAYEAWLVQIGREGGIDDALAARNQAKKRLLDSERALKPEKEEKPEPKEPKEEKKKAPDPVDRIREDVKKRQYIEKERAILIQEILDSAKATGVSPDSDKIRREIENVTSDFDKLIADTYGR